jgi:hypothetical protein
MKSVHASLLHCTDFQFGHQYQNPTFFVPITGTIEVNILRQQLPPDTRCVCHRLIDLTDNGLINIDARMSKLWRTDHVYGV